MDFVDFDKESMIQGHVDGLLVGTSFFFPLGTPSQSEADFLVLTKY